MTGQEDRIEGLTSGLTSHVPDAIGDRAAAAGTGLVILPTRVDEAGRGIYPDGVTFLVKELRSEGVDAAFLDPSDRRLFEVKNSALLDLLNTVAVGVLSSAAWDGFKALLRSRASTTPMTITYLNVAADGTRQEITVTGAPEDALSAIDRLRIDPPEPRDDL